MADSHTKKILTKVLNVECKNVYMKNTIQNRVWFKGAMRSGVKCALPNTPLLFFFDSDQANRRKRPVCSQCLEFMFWPQVEHDATEQVP